MPGRANTYLRRSQIYILRRTSFRPLGNQLVATVTAFYQDTALDIDETIRTDFMVLHSEKYM